MIEILEPKEVCKLLKVCRTTLAQLPIKTVTIGKREKYTMEAIKEFLKEHQNTVEYKTVALAIQAKRRLQVKDRIRGIREVILRKNDST